MAAVPSAQRVRVVTQLVRDWESGNASFDRGALIRALASGDGPIVENSAREWYYKWALFGPARREAPDSFSAYVGTCPVRQGDPCTGFEDDAQALVRALKDLPFSAGSEAFTDTVKQVRGLMEYMCTKTSSRYDSTLMLQLLPLVQVAVDRQIAEGLSDTAPSLRITFLIWFMLRQSVGAFPATSNLRSYRDLLTLTYEMLLQYHDPGLGLHLAQLKSDYASANILTAWLPTLFSAVADDVRATLPLIDQLIVGVDEALPALLPVAFLIQYRDIILSAQSKADVKSAIASIRLQPGEATAIFASAKHLLVRTPYSVRRCFREHLFSPIDAATLAAVPDRVARLQANVVLPVEADELMDAFTCATDDPTEPRPPHLNYVVLDCRAEKSFHHARLPTAVHVGNAIGFDPDLLRQMVANFESARGSHLSIMGTGRGLAEELNLLKIIALQFVQAGFPHVSFADGGFKACVPRIKAGRAEVVRTPASDLPAAPTAAHATAGTAVTTAADSSRKSGSRDNSVVPAAAAAAAAGAPATSSPTSESGPGNLLGKQLVSDETKEKLRQAQAKAADNLQAAKSWGLGLVSKWTAKKADAPPPPPSSTLHSTTGVTSPPEGARLSTGTAGGAESPAPAPPSGGHGEAPPAPMFRIDDDDDDDFGIITKVPTAGGEAAAAPAVAAPERAVSVVSLQEVLARANSNSVVPTSPTEKTAADGREKPSDEPKTQEEGIAAPPKTEVPQPPTVPQNTTAATTVDDDDDFGIMTTTTPAAVAAPTTAPVAVAAPTSDPVVAITPAPVQSSTKPTPAPTVAPTVAAKAVDDDENFGLVTTTTTVPAPAPAASTMAAKHEEHHPFDDIFQ